MSYTNIIAKPKQQNKNLAFAITDEEGKYNLKLKKGVYYSISVSFMGYKTIKFNITPTKNILKNFILKETSNQLDEIIIELPVTVKEDTIIYNTKRFVTGEERKLKNVLKKLPGVEVDKNGNVTVQGEKVTKILVDGKKFFGGGSKLAVDNIPADAVDKVVVLENYNEVAFLKNLSDNDEMVMDIKLKEDKKRFAFGDIEAGKGNQNFHNTQANLFYYSPKTNINFIGNSNNVGNKTFTFEDYLSFSGGINAIFKGNFNFRRNDFSQFLQSQDLVSNRQNFTALNIAKTTSNELDISGYAIFSNNKTGSFFETINEYSSFTEDKEVRNNNKNIVGISKFSVEYLPNYNEEWYFHSFIKKNNNDKNNIISSEINTLENIININNEDEAWYFSQNIEWHKKQSQKHTFSSTINFIFDRNNPKTLWETNEPILQNLIPIDTSQNQFRLNQIEENKKNFLHTVFKEFWILNNNNHIYSTIGNIYQKEKFISRDTQILDDNSQNDFYLSGFNNTTTFMLNDFFLGLHYKFRKGIFTLKQGVYLHNYNWRVEQKNLITSNKWVPLPDFLLKIEFNNSKKIKLNYNLKSNFSEASKLANRFYLKSYNSVFKGNETLENELSHSARIRYSRFSLYRGLLFTANANYNKNLDGFRNAVVFDGINQFLTIQMLENPNENWGLSTSIRKRIKKIRYKFSGNYNNSKYLQSIDNNFVVNKNESYVFNIGAETLFEDFPFISIGYKKSINNFTSNNSTSQFITDEPYINLDYDFLKGFIFSFDYTLFDYQNMQQNIKNKYTLANTTLSYRKENSAWSYKIEAKNLFNTEFKQSNRFSDYLISDTKTFILPRIIMFSIGYNL